jgi:hypothetical protein
MFKLVGAMASDDAANSADARQLAEVMAYLKTLEP